MPRRKHVEDSEDTSRWLLTYSDLITLLLAFFVIMYSMSRIDAKKFGKMSEHLQGAFHSTESADRAAADQSDLGSGVLRIGRLKAIAQHLRSPVLGANTDRRSMVGENILAQTPDSKAPASGLVPGDPISTEINERGLVIHVVESSLFDAGQATLKPEAMAVLDRIAKEVKSITNQVRVEGHTDDRPIATLRFPSNWELSSARATAVVRYFVNKYEFAPDRLSALGFGEYRPLAPNNSETNRAKNRRVDIVVLTDNLSRYEPMPLDTGGQLGSVGENYFQATLEDNSVH
jgi:chemotaxis protein MotB